MSSNHSNPGSLALYPCPCGFLMFSDLPGTYGICEICFWEDDPVQLRFPDREGGANYVSLIQAQKSYAAKGVSGERLHEDTRLPIPENERDPLWRPIDPMLDQWEELDPRKTYFELATEDYPDGEKLYYWRREV